MSKNSVACAVILTTLMVSVPLGQAPPNFAGRWILAGASSQPAQPLVVNQSATSLSVENWSSSGPRPGVYAWSTDSGPAASATPAASWNGRTLVVVFPAATSPDFPGAVTVRTESWSLDTTGKLTVAIDLDREQGPRIVQRFLYSRSDSR